MQQLTLTGNVGRDPEQRTTQGGDKVTSFSVASKQGFQRDAKTEWFRVSVWGKRGDTIASHLRKGMKVTVVGEFTIGEYQGKPRYDVRANEVDWQPAQGGTRGEDYEEPMQRGLTRTDVELDDDVPF